MRKLDNDDDDDTQVYKRPWVGLTVDEFCDLDDVGRKLVVEYGKKVEAKLKEKNT